MPCRDGMRRGLDPRATYARLLPILPAIGVTRIAMLTGLDTIGIEVAAAYRPNSRSISVHQGKGADAIVAKVSAAMEALETFHAETADLTLRLGSHAEIATRGASVDPGTLPRSRVIAPLDGRMLWTPGRDLISDTTVWVPYALVGFDLVTDDLPGASMFQITTNGLAAGNDRHEAAIHALCEVVERDAVALWSAAEPAVQDSCAIDPSTIVGAQARRLLARFAAAGVAVRVWDVTSDIRLPVFVCLIASSDGVQPEIGSGCHLDREVALCRALAEAAQARLTVIAGARDDLDDEVYAGAARRTAAAAVWMRAPAQRPWSAGPSCGGASLTEDLATALGRLQAAGFDRAIAVDLTRPEIGIPVLRVIVPGLEGPWTGSGGDYMPGARARARLRSLAP